MQGCTCICAEGVSSKIRSGVTGQGVMYVWLCCAEGGGYIVM